jgi:hypothetical protein
MRTLLIQQNAALTLELFPSPSFAIVLVGPINMRPRKSKVPRPSLGTGDDYWLPILRRGNGGFLHVRHVDVVKSNANAARRSLDFIWWTNLSVQTALGSNGAGAQTALGLLPAALDSSIHSHNQKKTGRADMPIHVVIIDKSQLSTV